jgi:ring-1,2-phenylacetyl-CoA epoxidase subunit PaaE
LNHLAITALERLTDDAVLIEFAIPDGLRDEYLYRPGQHVTVRFDNDGAEARRSYSLCTAPYAPDAANPRIRIAVKELGPGGFGHLAATKLAVGDLVDVLPPAGRFHLQDADPGTQAEHVAIAAGSGVTPVMAMIEAALARGDRFSLIYGNRTAASVMFLEELADLKDRHPETFTVLHVLSREPREAPLLSGRIDDEHLPRLLEALAPSPEAHYYLCGPMALVDTAKAVLKAQGIDRTHVHFELFHADDAPPPENYAATERVLAEGDVELTVHLTGRTTKLAMGKQDASVLDAVLRARADTPYSCTGGVCGTCRAKVLSGEVVMARDYALEPEEKAEGFVLACQSRPLTPAVELDFDA